MGAISTAVVFEQPGEMRMRPVELPEPHSTDCVVEIHWTGISTGTERLLWDGRMPSLSGLGSIPVPGYESVGSVVSTGIETHLEVGQRVFGTRQPRLYRGSWVIWWRCAFSGCARRKIGITAL